MWIKKPLRKTLDTLGKYRLYFNRGHITYIALPITLFNFVTIAYNLELIKIPILQKIFPSFWVFGLLFLIILIPLAILFGKLDFKKGTYKKEVLVALSLSPAWDKNQNPIWIELFANQKRMVENQRKLDEKIAKLEKLLEGKN